MTSSANRTPAPASSLLLLILGAAPALGVTPVTSCGFLASGSYQLVQSLAADGGDCLIVDDFVTLDLARFAIEQRKTAEKSVGIGGGRTGVVIKNGTIRGFGQAIEIGAFSTVTDLTIGPSQLTRSGEAVRLGDHCRFVRNRLRGSTAGVFGTRGLVFGQGCYVADNVVDPGAAAIGLTNGAAGASGSVVARNVVRHDPATSPEDGINLGASQAVLLVLNSIDGHPHLGLRTGGASVVFDNTLLGIPSRTGVTASQGITAGPSSLIQGNDLADLFASLVSNGRSLVAENTVRQAREQGITEAASGSSASLIARNKVLGATGNGIQVQGGNTLVEGNTVADTGGTAVECALGGTSAVRDNVATGSIGAGVVFDTCEDLGGNTPP